MQTNKLFGKVVIIPALLASLCCITPVLAVLGGISGIASSFSFLDPLRPYFIAFTVVVLGYAFYNAYKPRKKNDVECNCEQTASADERTENKFRTSFINSKKFLWIITAVSIVLISFPYYSQVFFPEPQYKQSGSSNHIVKAKIEIEGMSCPTCEHSINYALKSEKGVVKAESSYKTGTAYVQFDTAKVKSTQLKKAIEKKVGYKVKSITTLNGKNK